MKQGSTLGIELLRCEEEELYVDFLLSINHESPVSTNTPSL